MIYIKILKLMKPLIKWWGHLYAGFHKPLIGSTEYAEIISLIRPYDVLLTKTNGEFSNLINPSAKYCHGALALPDGSIWEATGKGVWPDRMDNFCYKKDKIMIVRPRFNVGAIPGHRIGIYCEAMTGHLYDMEFEKDDAELYCFEGVAMALQEAGVILKTHKILDGEFYTSDTFLDEEKFEIIYQSDKKNALRIH